MMEANVSQPETVNEKNFNNFMSRTKATEGNLPPEYYLMRLKVVNEQIEEIKDRIKALSRGK